MLCARFVLCPSGPLNDENGFPYPSPIAAGSTIYYPQTDGSSTLTSVFGTGSTPAAGTWSLYVQDGSEDAVTIDGWNLYLTATAPTKTNTTTTLSTSLKAAYATNTVTYTATVKYGTSSAVTSGRSRSTPTAAPRLLHARAAIKR